MRKAIPATLLSLLMTLLATNVARAADDAELEYDVSARVLRVSLIKGEVSVKRQGSDEWESAKVNLPLVEGDTVATGSNGLAEIQIDARNFARLDSDSILKIITLRDEGIALSLSRGTATVRLARFDRDREYFEIDAPRTTIAAERKGLYRVDVAPSGRVQVTVRDDGRARVYSETSGFIVRDGHTATLDFSASEEGDWSFAQALARDAWDDWVTNREAYLAARLRYDDRVRYYDSDLWGAEELDAYGDWAYVNDYGWIWRPHVTVINNYNNWAPYRHGYWTWFQPYGWTWVGYEPWGWAPYHYGRWVYHNNYWAWSPRGPNHRRSWWRPALVAFVNINFGSNYCWYPLPYHHRDPRSRHYGRDGRDDRWRGMRPEELARLRRVDPAYFRAVTSQTAGQFGSQHARPQPASTELARRAVGMEPLRGDLPVRPAVTSDRSNAVAGDRQARTAMARPASVTAALLERPTGAAVRQPGVALDEDLRRSRVLNGRELLRPVNPAVGGSRPGDSVTGAVMRQARPVRQPGMRDKEDEGHPGSSSPVERTARPMAKPGIDIKENQGNQGTAVERPARPAREPRTRSNDGNTGGSSPVERPARPVRDPVTREKEPDRSNDEPATPRRSEPSPRYEPPARSEPPPQRSEPSPRYEPPARSEPPPQRSEPSPRYEPPPQRSEPAPRYEPPARSDPPPQRSEPPARSDPPPQRSEPAPQRSEPSKPSEDRPSRADRKNDG